MRCYSPTEQGRAQRRSSDAEGGRHFLLHDDEADADDEADGQDDADGRAHVGAVCGKERPVNGARGAAVLRPHEGRLRALEHAARGAGDGRPVGLERQPAGGSALQRGHDPRAHPAAGVGTAVYRSGGRRRGGTCET